MAISIRESHLSHRIIKTYELKVGTFYFFEDFIVVEYAKDTLVSFSAIQPIMAKRNKYFPNNRPFGLIVNKINPYNTVPSDAVKLEKEVPNLVATAVVGYNCSQTIHFDLENYFFKKINRKLFNSLEQADTWLSEIFKTEQLVISNKSHLL
ncbi:hypothetical protein OS188_05465 [Xanthomarina sp. F1114]|uniref:hypothetical protein n=1 Tax=Xanthomarina sp. F1114 TaxID=2996019 RepID=UPI00225E4C04|nr:hypothetical protein [Xanthomarina sp. F1114]MCX7547400.1 hypothetical protein [Xanthomarina sp. F1114]